MAELLAIPGAAPAMAPVAIAGSLDASLLASTTIATDPFASLLATAQAVPATALAQPAPIAPADVPAMIFTEGDQPGVKAKTTPGDDDEAADMPDDPAATAIVDPALSPALAMLSALVAVQPDTPRPAAAAPRARPAIGMKTAKAAPTLAPPASAPTTAAAPPTAAKVAIIAPTTPAVPATALATPTDTVAVTIPAAVVAANPTPTAEIVAQITIANDGRASAAPAPTMPPHSAPLTQAAAAATTLSPPSTAPAEAPSPAKAVSAVAEEPAVAIVAETTETVENRPTLPVKLRASQSRVPSDRDTAATPTSERSETGRPNAPLARASASVAATPRADPIAAPVVQMAAEPATSAAGPAAPAADLLVQRQLTIADDGRWLDGLARDIAQSASGGTLHFRLEPVNLGSLTVAIAQSSDGTAIRMTAETHRARDLLVDAQPALVAEARANGLRISETHVDLGSANRDSSTSNPQAGSQQPSFANTANGQQTMRQDGNPRRQPDLPAAPLPQSRSAEAAAPKRDSGERFA